MAHRRSPEPIRDTPTSVRRMRQNTPRCVWPKCGAPVEDIPLCQAHLVVAATIANTHAQGEPFTFRVRQEIDTAPDRPAIPEKPSPMGTVYYVRSGAYIKIGWSADLEKRMRAYAPDSVLLATEPGDRQLETRRHRMFAAHRTHGREWYAMVPALLHHIDTVAAEHGKPDAVTFAAKPVTIPQPRPKSYVGGNYRGNGPSVQPRWP